MSAPPSDAPERMAVLFDAGLGIKEIVARLHYSRSYVFAVRAQLRREGRIAAPPSRNLRSWTPPPDPEIAKALEYGRRLVADKVAAGAWVLPKGGGR